MKQATPSTSAHFSIDFLKKIKALLLADQARLEKELVSLSSDASGQPARSGVSFPKYGDEESQNALEVAEFEANLSIDDSLKKAFRDVQSALARLEKNNFGVCKYCLKPISEARLLARPTSSSCVECKKTITQEA